MASIWRAGFALVDPDACAGDGGKVSNHGGLSHADTASRAHPLSGPDCMAQGFT